MEETQPLRLNVGAGSTEIDGFVNLDRKSGQEAFPLDYPENSVDEIRASHVLEHFPYREVREVLDHWISRLKPGGLLRIAVPDFEYIAKRYDEGAPIPTQPFVMGGQVDENDFHKAIFDKGALTETMVNVGLERIGPWFSEVEDCAALPVSLNMMGFKPLDEHKYCANTCAILSCPRFGPTLHFRSVSNGFGRARVPYSVGIGAYWWQELSKQLEEVIAKPEMEFVFTADYDSVFSYGDVLELWRLIRAHSEADAIIPMQAKRGGGDVLVGMDDAEGKARTKVYKAEFQRHLTQVNRGHFGLTIFRADTLRHHPRPWMTPVPGDNGRWDDSGVHCDINFWHRWQAEGRKLFLANHVVIGHLEEVVSWPRLEDKAMYQSMKGYIDNGIPAEVAR